MTNKNFYAIAMMIISMMMSGNANAQNRAGNGREMRMHSDGRVEMAGGRTNGSGYASNADLDYQMQGGARSESYSGQMNSSRPYDDRYDDRGYEHRDDRYNDRQMADSRCGDYGRDYYTPRVDSRGYVPGYEGRVMYRDGRWGYLRGSDWYWYSRYFDPVYYFAHPVRHFHSYHIPVDGRVVAGVAGAVVLGSIIHALIR